MCLYVLAARAAQDSLPILKKPRDVLRAGRESYAHAALPKHPVERAQALVCLEMAHGYSVEC